jgi:hypothetical protein
MGLGKDLLGPRGDLLQILARGFNFGRTDVFQGRCGVSIERRESGQVELDESRGMRYVAVPLEVILTSMRRILPTPLHITGLVSRIP